jgi:hypothetical protein
VPPTKLKDRESVCVVHVRPSDSRMDAGIFRDGEVPQTGLMIGSVPNTENVFDSALPQLHSKLRQCLGYNATSRLTVPEMHGRFAARYTKMRWPFDESSDRLDNQ